MQAVAICFFFATYAIIHAVVVFVVDVVYTKYLISIKFIFNLIRFSLIFLVQFSSVQFNSEMMFEQLRFSVSRTVL